MVCDCWIGVDLYGLIGGKFYDDVFGMIVVFIVFGMVWYLDCDCFCVCCRFFDVCVIDCGGVVG